MRDFLHNFFADPVTWMGLAVGFAVSVWQHLSAISKTLRRIEVLLQEGAREADRIIRKTGAGG